MAIKWRAAAGSRGCDRPGALFTHLRRLAASVDRAPPRVRVPGHDRLRRLFNFNGAIARCGSSSLVVECRSTAGARYESIRHGPCGDGVTPRDLAPQRMIEDEGPEGNDRRDECEQRAGSGQPRARPARYNAARNIRKSRPCTLPTMRTASGRPARYLSGIAMNSKARKDEPSRSATIRSWRSAVNDVRLSPLFGWNRQLGGVGETGGHFRKNAQPDVDRTHGRPDRREGARKPQRAENAAHAADQQRVRRPDSRRQPAGDQAAERRRAEERHHVEAHHAARVFRRPRSSESRCCSRPSAP